MKRILLFVTSLALLTQAGSAPRAQTPDALTFFKNFFVTGDYVVGGVGLRGRGVNGIATGSIELSGVPQKADVLAAFLYWQVVAKGTGDAGGVGVTFHGHPLSAAADQPFAKVLGTGIRPAGVQAAERDPRQARTRQHLPC